MFINVQNFNFNILEIISSPNVITKNTVLDEGETFDSLLMRLFGEMGKKAPPNQPTGDLTQPLISQTEKLLRFIDAATLEKTDTYNAIAPNAEIIIESDDIKNISLPVLITFTDKDGNIEPDNTSLFNIISEAKNPGEIETENPAKIVALKPARLSLLIQNPL